MHIIFLGYKHQITYHINCESNGTFANGFVFANISLSHSVYLWRQLKVYQTTCMPNHGIIGTTVDVFSFIHFILPFLTLNLKPNVVNKTTQTLSIP